MTEPPLDAWGIAGVGAPLHPTDEGDPPMNKQHWKAVAERAVKTAAQSAILVFGADQVNAIHVSWAEVGGFAAGGFVLSVLTSLASEGFGGNGPSLTTERVE